MAEAGRPQSGYPPSVNQRPPTNQARHVSTSKAPSLIKEKPEFQFLIKETEKCLIVWFAEVGQNRMIIER